MIKKSKGVLFFLIVLFTSCSITQEFYFNKDFSGSAKMTIDMSSFMEMMSGLDTTGNSLQEMRDSLDFVFTESAQKLDSVGVKDIDYGWGENSTVLYMTYKFDNIDVLNKALNSSDMQGSVTEEKAVKENHTYFIKEGRKTLTYKGVKSDKDISNNKDMESMKDYYKYAVKFNFERKIRKIDNPNYNVSEDNKSAELKGSMFEIIRPEYNSDITFKLK